MKVKKFIVLFGLHLLTSQVTFATAVEEKGIKFMPSTEALMKGEIHYALDVVDPSKMNEKYPDLFYLDSLSFSQEPHVKLVIAKSAYVVNKPAGFFDHLTVGNEKFLNFTMGEQKVKKISDNVFKVTVPGEFAHSYYMKTYFDSDDISTLPNSKVIRAVTQARKLDVISGSASATVFREYNLFTKFSVGAVQVSSFIPLKEDKTLIINYHLTGVKKFYALEKVLKSHYREEAETQKKLIDQFKAE